MRRTNEWPRTPRNAALSFLIVTVMAVAACGQDEGSASTPGDIGLVKAGLDSTGGGFNYANQCTSNNVPYPSSWGASSMGTGEGQWTLRGTFNDSYNGIAAVTIYTMNSTSPAGICAIAIKADGQFDVLCQGTNGKACFWEAGANFWRDHDLSPPPPQIPQNGNVTIVGLIPAAPDQGTQCTQCHAGENAFITHPQPGHPTNMRELSTWMPAVVYDPIVPSTWTQNKNFPSTSGYPSSCQGSCHGLGGPTPGAGFARAGRFPLLRTHDLDGYYCDILRKVTSRPASQGGMPPNVADCVPGSNCPLDNDSAVQAMVNNCGHPLAPTSVPSATTVGGLGGQYGAPASTLSTKMHVSQSAQGMHQHYFYNATTTMPSQTCCLPHQNSHPVITSDDRIIVWVFIPTGDAPREIMIQINDGTNWHRAYWGDDLIGWSPRFRIGDLPATGSWQQLSFKLNHLNMAGGIMTIKGMAYTLFNGSAYWADTLFKQGGNYTNQWVSQVWVKDSIPSGATVAADGDAWTFVTP